MKINNKKIIKVLIVLIFMIILGTLAFLRQTDRMPEIDIKAMLAQVTGNTPVETEEIELAEDFIERMRGNNATGRNYSETANAGEGLTHLARRAAGKYIQDNGIRDITPEHKIYIEDYIVKKMGNDSLSLGEVVVISEELITEAINNSLELEPNQLENLRQYSALVSSF